MRSLLIGLLLAKTAMAGFPPPDYTLAYERGANAYDHGDYESALAWFTQLSEATHAPNLLFNLAMVHLQLGNCSMARLFYRRFLKRSLQSGLLAERWFLVDPNRERYLRFEKRLVSCIYEGLPKPIMVLDESIGVNRWDFGNTYWPTPGLW